MSSNSLAAAHLAETATPVARVVVALHPRASSTRPARRLRVPLARRSSMSLASSASRPSVVALAPRRRRALLPSSSRVALPLPLPTRRASSTPMPPECAKRDASAAAAASDATYVPGEEIKNAVVVVTGANRGIGLEFVSQILAKHPSNAVIATSRDATSCVDLLALRESFGDARLAVTTLDVADEASIASWAAAVRDLPLGAFYTKVFHP
jgi:hypothetical protein